MDFNIELFKKSFDFLPLGLRINNPGCIRYTAVNRWQGQKGSYKGFAQFEDFKYGVRALTALLMRYLYSYRLFDIDKLLQRYAPYQDGNFPYYYAHYVRNISGVKKLSNNIRLLKIELPLVIYAISTMECGTEFHYKSNNDEFRSYLFGLVVEYMDEFLNSCVYPVKGKVDEL